MSIHRKPWTLTRAQTFTARLEPLLAARGMHVALTGSVLYGGGTGKDLDLLVFPHCAAMPRPLDATLLAVESCMKTVGFERWAGWQRLQATWRSRGSDDTKIVELYSDGDRRIDVIHWPF